MIMQKTIWREGRMSFIIEEYRQADPIEISNRLGIAYDVQKSEFIIFFMGCQEIRLLFRET